MASYALPFSYVLCVVATVGAVVLPLVNSLSSPKKLLGTLTGVAVLVLLYFISYAISDSEVTARYTVFDITETGSKAIGGSLIMVWILMIIASVGIVVTEVSKFFK